MEGATKFATNGRRGFAFLVKNGEWTKKQLHGKYRWRNEKNVHELPMCFFENTQHSMSGTNVRKDLDGIIGFLDKGDGSPLTLCFFHGKKKSFCPIELIIDNGKRRRCLTDKMVDSKDYMFFPVTQISGNTGWNGNHSFDNQLQRLSNPVKS